MCIAAFKPRGIPITKAILENMFEKNPDGAGIAYCESGKIVISKGFFKKKDFIEAVKKMEHEELLIHCRIKTHGDIGHDNCHPFFYQNEAHPQFSYAFIHNGILPWESTKEKSDTRHFIEEFIAPIIERDPEFLDTPHGAALLGSYIGENKIVVMKLNSEKNSFSVIPINKDKGITEHGIWFSNMTYTSSYGRAVTEWDRRRALGLPMVPVNHGYGYEGGYGRHYVGPGPSAPPVIPAVQNKLALRTDEEDDEYGDWKFNKEENRWENTDPTYKGDQLPAKIPKSGSIVGIMPRPASTPSEDKGKVINLAAEKAKIESEKSASDWQCDVTTPPPDAMTYLDPEQRKELRKVCYQFIKEHFEEKIPTKGLDVTELAELVRQELRYQDKELAIMPDQVITLWILKRAAEGGHQALIRSKQELETVPAI